MVPLSIANRACSVRSQLSIKALFVLTLGLISPLFAIPANTTLTLVNDPNFNKITVKVDPGSGLSDTDVTTLTGTVQAFFNVNPANGQTTELTLANGRGNGNKMNFARTAFFNLAAYNINVTNLSAAIYTIAPPGVVTPATGIFAANQHRFDIDQGTITGTTSGLIGNNAINESFTPQNTASGTGTGNGTVVLTAAGVTGIYRNYTVTATFPVSIADTFLAGVTSVAITATGTVKATGTLQVPRTEYLAWTIAQNIPNAPFNGDPNGDGVSNGLLWALGLNVNSDPLPHLPHSNPAVPGGFIVPLPAGGTGGPILIQSSPHLASWGPATAVAPVANPIPAGTRGNVTIGPDASPRRFVRLLVTEP
jgi:hypothetical protein